MNTNKLLGTCKKVDFIKNIKPGLDLCSITIDFDEIKIFYNSSDLAMFVNQIVEYSVREDVYEGAIITVITDIAIMKTVQTVESVENVKLIPEGNSRTVCNFAIKDIRFGEFYPSKVAYLSKVERGSSPATKWVDMTMLDIESREFKLRMFTRDPNHTENSDEVVESFIGHYVIFDLQSTQYGYQTREIEALTTEVELSPEVIVAEGVVRKIISDDLALKQLDSIYGIVQVLKNVIDGEPGYQLVRMASEIYLINAVSDISTNIDIKVLKRAVVCSRLYLLPHKHPWSRPLLNVNKCNKVQELQQDRELMSILDPINGEEMSDTKRMYIKLRGIVDDIIKIRRGVKDEKDDIATTGYMSMFNGLL